MIRFLNWTLRLALGAVFIFAGTLKILDPAAFATDISHYRIPPAELINLIAITLPWIEVVAGLCLMVGVWPRASALVLGFFCLVFIAAIGQAMVRGLDIHCGCFGTVGAQRLGARNLAIDLGLLVLAGWLVWRDHD